MSNKSQSQTGDICSLLHPNSPHKFVLLLYGNIFSHFSVCISFLKSTGTTMYTYMLWVIKISLIFMKLHISRISEFPLQIHEES